MTRLKANFPELKPGQRLALLLLSALCLSCSRPDPGHELKLHAFGTVVSLAIHAADPATAEAASAALQAEFRRVDADWYPWQKPGNAADGELRRLNEAIAGGRTFAVSADLARLIRVAAELEDRSEGRFNPAIGALTELWGFNDAADIAAEPPERERLAGLDLSAMSARHLRWDGDSLSSQSSGVMLDLGGIAKGAILELSAALLRQHGIGNAIVDIGGDLIVLGNVHGRAARIGIRSPSSDGVIGWLQVAAGEAVLTSGDYERYFEYQGQRYQHILDPQTGSPVAHTSAVTVVHRDAVLADAAATALVVAGAADFDRVCRLLGVEDALLITATGDLRLTDAMRKRVKWSDGSEHMQ